MSHSLACPSCQRPAVGRAFGTTSDYARCSLGHVFPFDPAPADKLGDPTYAATVRVLS